MTSDIKGWKFLVSSEKEMSALGCAFSRAARLDKRPADLPDSILHIGLKAPPDTGKSVFASGFLSGLTHLSIESCTAAGRSQSLCETEEAGWVRHYDALMDEDILPARATYLLERNGWAGTDLAEHPDKDYGPWRAGSDDTPGNGAPGDDFSTKNLFRDTVKCDYVVSLRARFQDNARIVTVQYRAPMEDNRGFRDFLLDAFTLVPARHLDSAAGPQRLFR